MKIWTTVPVVEAKVTDAVFFAMPLREIEQLEAPSGTVHEAEPGATPQLPVTPVDPV